MNNLDDQKISIYKLAESDRQTLLAEGGFPKFRNKQISDWLLKGVVNPEEMSNLPKELRNFLSERFLNESIECQSRLVSAEDETKKYVFRLADGNIVEAVYMRYRYGSSVCISSQAGCQMGCKFCASADAGFGRNLTAGEMLAQVAYIGRDIDTRIDGVVVMGIGEPLENYDELKQFIELVNDPKGLNIGRRHITVSTCGIIPQMIKFTNEVNQVSLAVSLHAPNDKLRRELMPIAKVYRLEPLMDACRYYIAESGRRLTFEYALFAGVNDSVEQAEELASLVKGMNCLINLIPANEFPGSQYKRSNHMSVQAFRETLEAHNIQVTVRRELGKDILAACGQLRRRLEDG